MKMGGLVTKSENVEMFGTIKEFAQGNKF